LSPSNFVVDKTSALAYICRYYLQVVSRSGRLCS